jgi:8-oxo-dGTP pyrophosphatase MutT (NUDIX family)
METTRLPLRIRREGVLYKDQYQELYKAVAEFDGFTKTYHVSKHGDRAALLVVRDDHILLARQYRLIVNCVALEIPGGAVEEGETPDQSAVREGIEETGVKGLDPRLLLCYHPSLDILENYTRIYYSERCEEVGGVDADRWVWLPTETCLQRIFSQELTDVLTITAVLAYCTIKKGR